MWRPACRIQRGKNVDRDRNENVVDPVERVTPSTGENDTGDVGGDTIREVEKRSKRGTENTSRDTTEKRRRE